MVISIQYRKLAVEDLDRFIEKGICQLREEGAREDIDATCQCLLICHRSNSSQFCCARDFTERSEVGANITQLATGKFIMGIEQHYESRK